MCPLAAVWKVKQFALILQPTHRGTTLSWFKDLRRECKKNFGYSHSLKMSSSVNNWSLACNFCACVGERSRETGLELRLWSSVDLQFPTGQEGYSCVANNSHVFNNEWLKQNVFKSFYIDMWKYILNAANSPPKCMYKCLYNKFGFSAVHWTNFCLSPLFVSTASYLCCMELTCFILLSLKNTVFVISLHFFC